MKTFKLVMIAAMLVISAVKITNADGIAEKRSSKVINLTLIQALHVPGLPVAMLKQLDERFLGCGCEMSPSIKYYTQDVLYNNIIYRITGTYQEWMAFFHRGKGIARGNLNIMLRNN